MSGLAVTGTGAVTPLGAGARTFVAGVERGLRGTSCDDDAICRGLDLHRTRRLDRLSQILLVAAREAAADARLDGFDGDRLGVVVGTGLGCLEKTSSYLDGVGRAGIGFADPLTFPDSMDSAPAAHIAIALGANGPSMTVTQREISGECAILLAALLLGRGDADAVVVAAGDSAGEAATPLLRRFLGSDAPGEAGAAIVLERSASARARGARSHATLVGWAQASEAIDRTTLGRGSAAALARASDSAVAMARDAIGPDLEVFREVPGEVRRSVGWILGDGVLRSVLAMHRMGAGDRRAALVGADARGGSAAAIVLGAP